MAVMLSVGAGKEQVHSIKCAKSLGLQVVAVDANPDATGFAHADVAIRADIKDRERVIKIARQYRISGVLPSPIGRYLTTVGAVNDALGLPGIGEQAARNCTDKVLANQLLSENGVPCARQRVARGTGEIRKALNELGLPCVLKPRHGSGSKGVVVIRTDSEMDHLLRAHLAACGEMEDSLVEELLDGEEYGIDGVVIDGRFQLILARRKRMTPFPYRQEVAYLSPADFSPFRLAELERLMQRAVDAIGMNHCLVHADLLENKEGIMLIELAGRPAGLMMSERMVPFVTGVDPIRQFILWQVSRVHDFAVRTAKPMVLHFLTVPPGKVLSVPDREEILSDRNILVFDCPFKPGDILGPIKNGTDAYARGFLAATGSTVDEADRLALAVLEKFKMEQKEVYHESI